MNEEEQSAGSLIGIIIIVIIVFAGGFYLWRKESDAKRIVPSSQASTENASGVATQ